MTWFPFAFEGEIARFGVGRSRVVWYNVLFLPDRFAAEPPFDAQAIVRVDGEIADVPVAGAWMPTGDGRRWFIVSPAVFKASGVRVGDCVGMRFRLDDPDRVDVPEALEKALRRSAVARRRWEALTPGRRRGLAHTVASARTPATVAKRVQAVLDALKA